MEGRAEDLDDTATRHVLPHSHGRVSPSAKAEAPSAEDMLRGPGGCQSRKNFEKPEWYLAHFSYIQCLQSYNKFGHFILLAGDISLLLASAAFAFDLLLSWYCESYAHREGYIAVIVYLKC